jgi:class 3 adenylate cyclase
MEGALQRHDGIPRTTIEDHRGFIFSAAGDGFAAPFPRCEEAVNAAAAAHFQMAKEPWPEGAVELADRVASGRGCEHAPSSVIVITV